MTRAALLLLAVAGCADDAPAPATAALRPPYVATCPQGAPAPPAPQASRTIESIAVWATAVERAREQTEAVRAICARRLAEAVALMP